MQQTQSLVIRSLSPAMSKILLAFIFCSRAMTVDDIRTQTGLNDRHTIYQACRDLADPAYGMLVKQTGEHGKDVWIPAGALLPMMRSSYFGAGGGGNSTTWLETQPMQHFQMVEIPPSGNEKDGQKAPKTADYESQISQLVEIPPAETGSIMMMIDESLTTTESSSIMNPKTEKQPTTETILGNMEILFGCALDPGDIPADVQPVLILAWIYKAFQDRKNLKNPCGMIRARLASHSPRKLPKNWQEHLPVEYLEAIGMAIKPAGVVIQDEPDLVRDDPPVEEVPRAAEGLSKIWDEILNILAVEMPRASFGQYVQDTRPVSWQPDLGLFQVLARADARAWLEDRMISTIRHYLSGILGQEVFLQFVEAA